ncbi:MAG: arginyl-tRNA synthetase [Hyperionvirus sp.]|uniref:arginine--tRNA ligase n=1 Tax=Hyperionvirus sp. TaxID=2487770 RepID=A0A3G5A8F2_9VIRU|nr:MAG: arginyl-tRNA synthetase [Hyperionvirus sp.]
MDWIGKMGESKSGNIIEVLGEKVLLAFKNSGLNIGGWKPKIMLCKLDDIDYTVNNIGLLFKNNGNEKVVGVLGAICKELELVSENMYVVSPAKFYINFCLNKIFLHRFVLGVLRESDVVKKAGMRLKIAVDFSSPNVAKEMHVGHLRSTIIGDVIANIAEVRGHEVLRINHIGDFGQNFGMIIEWIILNGLAEKVFSNELPISLQEIYKKAKNDFKDDVGFQERASGNTVRLQNGDGADIVVKLWVKICEMSRISYQSVYDRLGIRVVECGESFYQKFIERVVTELNDKKLTKTDIAGEKKRLVVESEYSVEKKKVDEKGDEYLEKSHDVLTLIKHNGGYTYDTTDVACLWYRLNVLRANKVYYVVDSGQSTHFVQLFDVAKKAKWLTDTQMVEHIDFGIVSGDDGKRLRSRDGHTIKLIDLLDRAIVETKRIMILNYQEHEKSKGAAAAAEKKEIAVDDETIKSLAYGSIKYADLSINRKENYTFSYERMLNFKGNTLIYVMYARIRALAVLNNIPKEVTKELIVEYFSQFAGSGGNPDLNKGDYDILLKMATLESVMIEAEKGYPHHICKYLFNLADLLNNSYSANRCIMYAPDGVTIVAINKSRVALYHALVKIMDVCFGLLNIKLVNKL